MISKEFFKALELISTERRIEKEKILEIMERGLLNAYKKAYNHAQNVRIEFNEDKNEIQIYAIYEVVREKEDDNPEQMLLEEALKIKKTARFGDIIEVKVTPKDFGRIAASSAKQILTQGLKQLEREKIYEVFKNREDEIINAEIASVKKDFVTLYIGHDTQTSIPVKELLSDDEVSVGTRLKVYITKVEMTTKGPKIYVSRTDKNLIKRLLENVVPEIEDGIVEIMGISRDAGDRSKIAVFSHEEKVDPVGACLGQKGSRIKEVIEALNGEKLDIYKWDNDPKILIANAIQPSDCVAVLVNQRETSAIAIVPDDQLSLAIGKRGQNARLAVQSCGWKIDIKSESDAKKAKIAYKTESEE